MSAWDVFVASLDLAELERERMRRPVGDERPGGRADRRMRDEHAQRRVEFWTPYREALASERAAQIQEADANAFIAERSGKVPVRRPGRVFAVSDEELDRRFAAYKARRELSKGEAA